MKNNNSKSFIYVIGYDVAGPLKIGISANPEKRLRQLQTGQDKQLRLFHIEETIAGYPRFMEGFIHSNLAPKRIKGEWFDVAVEDAIAEVKFSIMTWECDPLLKLKATQKRR